MGTVYLQSLYVTKILNFSTISYTLKKKKNRDIPTKMDNDVMTALHSVQVDPDLHPFVFKWHTALQNHSLEERNK